MQFFTECGAKKNKLFKYQNIFLLSFSDMKIFYYGHSCFGVEINRVNLLFDPFISPNELAQHIDISKIKADYIFVSHGHEDHIADTVSIAKRTGAKVVSNWEIYNWAGKQGIDNAHPMNSGGKWKFENFSVKCTGAVHSSSFPDGTYAGNPLGFIIESGREKFYYSGDTALSADMKLIGDYDKPGIAFLPLGDNFTMGIDDAVIAAKFIGCRRIFGIHYNTFGFIMIDTEEAKRKFSDAGFELILMNIGETLEV